jgi:DNA-directed RNA polymerase specialized sigma24 family protein
VSDDPMLSELKKIANLLAQRELAAGTKGQAAAVLARCGFSNREIAALIETSEGSVRALLSQGRKRVDEPSSTG